MSSGSPPRCPQCSQPMKFGGFALCDRGGERVCRGVWACLQRHIWWQWADRPETSPERCPHPELFVG
ncbi:dehydrogenase [Streptomyces sp. ms191]|nr:dehydrogenase [Streptomyces sp. ms191]